MAARPRWVRNEWGAGEGGGRGDRNVAVWGHLGLWPEEDAGSVGSFVLLFRGQEGLEHICRLSQLEGRKCP